MKDKIDFTPAKLAELKKVYDKTVLAGKDRFTFEGHEVLVSYAKFLIEFLDRKFRT